ncbi:unnamed protein product [Symbiodinium sp. KB8]|nr:unnamed protein product [Symbiodinium sp. KB8]
MEFPDVAAGSLQCGPVSLNSQSLDRVTDQVRALAERLLPLVPEPTQRAADTRLFEEVLGWMERFAVGLTGDGRSRHTTETLFNGVFFGACLNSVKNARKAIPLAMKLAIPDLDLESLSKQFPEDATLRRASTYLDLAFTLFARELWSEQPSFHWAWADSSPQSSRDWLMLRHVSCSKAEVLETFRSVNKLILGREDFEQHFEATSLDLSEVGSLHNALSRNIQEHACLPVAMGSARVSIEDKCSAFLHSTVLECNGINSLRQHLDNFVSWTTDLGVEVGIPAFVSLKWQDLLPAFFQQPLEGDVMLAEDGAGDPAPASGEPVPLMPRALIVPGALHLIHNLTSDLHNRLPFWNEFFEHLKHIVHLLAVRHERERFLATCVRHTASAEFESLFERVNMSGLYEKRWQAVLKALQALLPVFEALRGAWSREAFLHGSADSDAGAAAGVDAALKSSKFCAYVFMVHAVHEVLGKFQDWLEACPCHENKFPFVSSTVRRKKRRKLFSKFEHVDCAMRGKRAAELAHGQVDSVLTELFNISFLEGADFLQGALNNADSQSLHEEFNLAKTYLHFGLVQKFEFWQKIPWRLCGLSHHFTSAARHAAAACLSEYDASFSKPSMTVADHHPLSVEFLSPGGPLRASLETFVAEGRMSLQLEEAVARLKFVPVTERVIEGMHRDVKIAAKHIQLGPSKVSMTVRLPEIVRRLESNPSCKAALIRFMDITRHARQSAGALGLSSHPLFVGLVMNKDFKHATWLRAITTVVHRCELDEQFASYASITKTHEAKKDKDAKRARMLHDVLNRPVPRTYDSIMRRCIVDHLRAHADTSRVYSLPVEDSYSVQSLVSNTGVGAPVGEAAERRLDESKLFFRVLHARPSKLKRGPAPIAAPPTFPVDSLVVTVHSPIAGDGEPVIDINSRAVPQLLLSLESCAVREKLLQWSPKGFQRDPDTGRWLVQLTDPTPVCRIDEQLSLDDVESMDTMQLFLALERNGFTWAKLPERKSDRQALKFAPGDPKIFYTSSHAVSSSYLCCLLLADRLVGDGEEQVPAIPHWVSKPAKVYPAILHGRISELQRLQEPLPALMADVDDEEPHPALAAAPYARPGAVQDEVADEGQGSARGSDADSDSVLRELERLMEADEVDSVGENQSVDCEEAAVEVEDLQDVHAHASEAHAEEVQEEPVSVLPDVGHHVAEPESADASDIGSPEQIIAALQEPFGPFRFTYKRKSSQTACKKFLGLRNESAQELDAAVRALKDMAPDASTISAAVLMLADVEDLVLFIFKQQFQLIELVRKDPLVFFVEKHFQTSSRRQGWGNDFTLDDEDKCLASWWPAGLKAALDNITKKAKAQNRLAWLHETLNDPEQTKDMLNSYTVAMQKAKELGSRGPRKEAWSLVEYIEVVKATSKTKRTGRDQLMWKLQAIDFYKSLGGGGLSHSQAEKKWSDMEASYIAEGLEHDHDGPVDAPLRLPVRVADFVDQSDSISRQKQRTQPLIRDLVPRPDSEPVTKQKAKADEKQEDDAREEEEDPAEEDKGRKRKREKWFDRDREVNRAQKALAKDLERQQTQAGTLLSDWQKTQTEFAALPADAQKQLLGEKRIGETRMQCLEHLRGDEATLQRHLSSYQSETAPRSNASAASADARGQLGSAPPCQSYRSLHTFGFWEDELQKVLEAEDQDSISHIKTECNKIKDVVAELGGACRSAVRDMTRGIAAVKTAMQQREAKKAAQKQVMQTPNKLFAIAQLCLDVVEVEEGQADKADFNQPLLLRLSHDAEDSVAKAQCVQQFMIAEFKEQFNNQVPSHRLDRAHKKFANGSQIKDMIAQRAEEIFPPCKLQDGTDSAVASALDVMGIIVGKNTVKCTPEKSFLGSLRWALSGCREVIMVSAVAWQKFLVSNHKEAATLQLAKDKMWYLDEKLIKAFSDAGGTVFAASVKKGFGLYLPPAWLMLERITGPDCWVGFKVGVPCLTLQQNQDLKVMEGSWAQGDAILKQLTEMKPLAAQAPPFQKNAPEASPEKAAPKAVPVEDLTT